MCDVRATSNRLQRNGTEFLPLILFYFALERKSKWAAKNRVFFCVYLCLLVINNRNDCVGVYKFLFTSTNKCLMRKNSNKNNRKKWQQQKNLAHIHFPVRPSVRPFIHQSTPISQVLKHCILLGALFLYTFSGDKMMICFHSIYLALLLSSSL